MKGYFLIFVIPIVAAMVNKCPNDAWTEAPNRDKCIYKSDSNGSIFDNVKLCESLEGTAISIKTRDENDFIESNVTGSTGQCYWIGLQEIAYDVQKYLWTDNTQVSYTNWAPGNPVRAFSPCSAFAIQNGKWIQTSCTVKCSILCQIEIVSHREDKDNNRAIDRIANVQTTIITRSEAIKSNMKDNQESIVRLNDTLSLLLITLIILFILITVLIIALVIICLKLRSQ